jgi:thiol-disulfide isomerase/thioredoxin
MMIRAALTLTLIAGSVTAWGCRAESAAKSEDGTPMLEPIRAAAPFALATLDGDSLLSADISQNVMLINFWASWCAPCRAEIPELIEIWDEYHDRGLALVGVSVNDLPRDSREFAAEMEMPYPLAIGTPKMLEEYGLSPWLPTTLLVVDGQIVEEWVGPKLRTDLEYPIRVALGLAPPIAEVLHRVSDTETEKR